MQILINKFAVAASINKIAVVIGIIKMFVNMQSELI